LVINIKYLATCFGSLNHPQANFSKHSTRHGKCESDTAALCKSNGKDTF